MIRVAVVAGVFVTLATACTTAGAGPSADEVIVQPLPAPVVRAMPHFGCTGCHELRASRSRPPAPRPQPVHISVHEHSTPRATTAPVTTFVLRAVVGEMHDITMYCDHGTMANGQQTHPGAVATIRRDIPFGTTVVIEGMGTYVVEDRIGNGSEFDIWTSACSTALDFGRHRMRVNIQTTN